jgi:flagellar motor protein MotB
MAKYFARFSTCSVDYCTKSILLVMFLTASLIYSEEVTNSKSKVGFYKDNVYLQLGGGYSQSAGGYHKSANGLNKDIDPVFLNTGDYLNYFYSKIDKNKPYIHNGSIKTLRMEYGLSDHFGVGFSIRRTTYFISNFNTTNTHQSLAYSWTSGRVNQGGEVSAISNSNINYLMTKENIRAIDAAIGHAVFSYHTNPNNVWDRYISLSIGGGTNYVNSVGVTSGFLTFGTRYFIYPYLFLYGELEGGAMQIQHRSHNFFGRDLPFGTLYEASFQIGIGASGWEEAEVLDPFEVKKETLPKKQEDPSPKDDSIVSKPKEPDSIKSLRHIVLELKKLNLEDVELIVRENKFTVIFLHDLLFPISSDIIHLRGENQLRMVTRVFNKYPEINFLIEGHTDDTPFHKKTKGKFKNNFELSEARAWEVHRIMTEEKLSVKRIKCVGLGDTRPRRPNINEEDKRINRRIEIVADKDLSDFPEIIELLKP